MLLPRMMSPLSLGDLVFISANWNWFGWNSMGWYYRPIIIWLAVLYIYPWNHSLASNFTSLYGSRSYCYQAAWSVEVQWWWSPQPLNFLAKSLPWRFKSNCNDKSFLRLNLLFQGLVNQRASLRQQLFGTLEVLLPWRRNCLPALLLFRCVLAICLKAGAMLKFTLSRGLDGVGLDTTKQLASFRLLLVPTRLTLIPF